jgi:hypothetical protein
VNVNCKHEPYQPDGVPENVKVSLIQAPLPPRGQEVVLVFLCKHCQCLYYETKKQSLIQVAQ